MVVGIVIAVRDGLSEVRIPAEEGLISYNALPYTGVRLATYVMGTSVSFRGGKSIWNLKLTTPTSSAYNALPYTGVRLATYVMGTSVSFRSGKSIWNLKLTTPTSSAE